MCRSVVLDLLEEDRRVGFALDATQLVMEQGQAISPVATILLHEEWLKASESRVKPAILDNPIQLEIRFE
jgi:hypothetical protein